MNIRDHLLREAGSLASRQTVRRIELWGEIGRLEARRTPSQAEMAELEELRSDAENCRQALIRFGSYRPYQDPEPNCPYCWIVRGETVVLEKGSRAESYQCEKCKAGYPGRGRQ